MRGNAEVCMNRICWIILGICVFVLGDVRLVDAFWYGRHGDHHGYYRHHDYYYSHHVFGYRYRSHLYDDLYTPYDYFPPSTPRRVEYHHYIEPSPMLPDTQNTQRNYELEKIGVLGTVGINPLR